MEKMLDLYSDYLLSSFHQTTATGLSNLMDGQISHDKVSRFLSKSDNGSKELWQHVKSLVRKHETEDACLIFDDSIIEKPHTDESELVCWHYDHSTGKSLKEINILSAFYHSSDSSLPEPIRIPIMHQLVLKTILYSVVKTQKTKRKSEITKNAMMLGMIAQAIHNQLKFKYVLADSWFGSADNMRFIKKKKKFFIPIAIGIDMKSNRNAVLNKKDRNKGQWLRIRANASKLN